MESGFMKSRSFNGGGILISLDSVRFMFQYSTASSYALIKFSLGSLNPSLCIVSDSYQRVYIVYSALHFEL